jgi:hypothetical protein
MSKRKIVITLGLLISVAALIGIWGPWKEGFIIAAGVIIAFLSYLPDQVYCDECRKLITTNGHRDHIAAGEAPRVSAKELIEKNTPVDAPVDSVVTSPAINE